MLEEAIRRDEEARGKALRARNVIVVRPDPRPGDRERPIERPIGWPSTLSAAEALRSLRADLKRWGMPLGPRDVRIVRGWDLLLAPDAHDPPVSPGNPATVTGQAFLAANRGAAVLDAVAPGWHEGVDEEMIDQGSYERNVVDLAFGPEKKIWDLLEGFTSRHGETHPDDFILMGLDPGDLCVEKDQRALAAEVLDLYWRREVLARKDGRKTTPPAALYAATVRLTARFSPALGDPWKPPEARVEELVSALLSDPEITRVEFVSGPRLLGRPAERPADGAPEAEPEVPF